MLATTSQAVGDAASQAADCGEDAEAAGPGRGQKRPRVEVAGDTAGKKGKPAIKL